MRCRISALLPAPVLLLTLVGCVPSASTPQISLSPTEVHPVKESSSARVPEDPDGKLYYAIRFYDPQLLTTALAEGADINASLPPMACKTDSTVCAPKRDAEPVPLFVHAFNYGNIGALQLLADRGARFHYPKPVRHGKTDVPGAGYPDYASYALYCPDQRRVMVDQQGKPTERFAGCFDLYRTLVSGGYRFDRYDLAKTLQGRGWQFMEKYRYMRSHTEPAELAAFDEQEQHLIRQVQRELAQQQNQQTAAMESLRMEQQGTRKKRQIPRQEQSLLTLSTLGSTICKTGEFRFTSPWHYTVEHSRGVLVAHLQGVYPQQREIRFRIAAIRTHSGHASYSDANPPRFQGFVAMPGWEYRDSVKGWYPCKN